MALAGLPPQQEDFDKVIMQLALYTREDASQGEIKVNDMVDSHALFEDLEEKGFFEYLGDRYNGNPKIRLTKEGRERARDLMGERAIPEDQYTYEKEKVVAKDRQLKILKMLNKRQGELVYLL